MKNLIIKMKSITDELSQSNIGEHSAGCSYYTILAFIPLILLILTLTKYFGIDEKFFIYILEGIIPGNLLNEAVLNIVEEVQSKSVGTITLSALVTLWSAGKGFFALCRGLSAVYEVETENQYIKFKLRALISTIIFIVAVLLSLVLLVFGNKINLFLQEKFNIFSKAIDIILKSKIIISIVSITLILTLVYKFIPKHKYKIKKQIPGAIFSAVACNVISFFYSIYIDVFTGFSLMYGSLTTIVLAMLWIYACMYSILLGAFINKIISTKGVKNGDAYIINNWLV